jgi:hypothetical protein
MKCENKRRSRNAAPFLLVPEKIKIINNGMCMTIWELIWKWNKIG